MSFLFRNFFVRFSHPCLLAIFVGFIASGARLILQLSTKDVMGDLYFPMCAASSLLSGENPYGPQCAIVWQGKTYPAKNIKTSNLINFVIVDPAKEVKIHNADSAIVGIGIDRASQNVFVRDIVNGKYWSHVE